jgi:hypothetical protein
MRRRRIQSIASSLLLLISLGLLVTVGVLYIRDRNDDNDPKPPTPIPGHNTAIDVLEAFRHHDLNAEFGDRGTDARSAMLERPGQMVKIGDARAYVFIYPGRADQEAATLDVIGEDIDLDDVEGDPIEFESIELFTASNVAVVLLDANEETSERVAEAVAALT